jgi:ADP-ribosylglycohydrolase
MRTAPLAVFYWREALECRKASLADSAITHFDPRCQLACAVLNGLVREALHGADRTKIAATTMNELAGATDWLRYQYPDLEKEIQSADSDLKRDLEAASAADPELYGPELNLHSQAGFVRVAFRLALWEMLHATSFEEALVDVVNRGGDADTNAAITGALYGAFAGQSAIPERWQKVVLDALQDDLTNPLATSYHPRILTDFVNRIVGAI